MRWGGEGPQSQGASRPGVAALGRPGTWLVRRSLLGPVEGDQRHQGWSSGPGPEETPWGGAGSLQPVAPWLPVWCHSQSLGRSWPRTPGDSAPLSFCPLLHSPLPQTPSPRPEPPAFPLEKRAPPPPRRCWSPAHVTRLRWEEPRDAGMSLQPRALMELSRRRGETSGTLFSLRECQEGPHASSTCGPSVCHTA